MRFRSRIALPLLAVAALAFAGAAAAADELELVSLSPASGAMAPGSMVTATLRYRLESAASGKIGTYTLGVPGNPAHISVEVPVFVKKGKGTVRTKFGIKCDPQYPGPIHIKNLRYVLFAEAPSGPITATLVEKFRDVKFTWECPKEGGPQQPHRVIGAKLEAHPREYKGPCPVTIKFLGSIETNGPTTVKYIFKRSDSAIDTNDRHFTLAAAPFHQAVDTTWTLGGPGMVFDGWEQIYIETPNAGFTSNQAHFHIACDGSPAGGNPTGGPNGKADITSKKGITIGSVFIGWGGTGTLNPAEAIQSSPNNACAFNATYDMVNVGSVATSPAFLNRLKVDATSVVAINSGLSLNAGETKNITTQPYLPFGTHRLTLALDDDHNVAESDESPASNVKTVTYSLKGPCGPPQNLPGVAVPKR